MKGRQAEKGRKRERERERKVGMINFTVFFAKFKSGTGFSIVAKLKLIEM